MGPLNLERVGLYEFSCKKLLLLLGRNRTAIANEIISIKYILLSQKIYTNQVNAANNQKQPVDFQQTTKLILN